MFDDRVFEPNDARDEIDVIELCSQESDRFIVMDVSLDGFLGVIDLFTDCRNKIAFEVEGDHLPLVCLP